VLASAPSAVSLEELPNSSPTSTVKEKLKIFVDKTTSVNQASSGEDKIKLFMSIFRGRKDIFARRWYSQNLKRGGYQPVCRNESH